MIRIPCLPHKTIITDSLTVEDLKEYRQEWGDAPLAVFTRTEFDLLQYAPSALSKINETHGVNLPVDPGMLRAEFESKVASEYAILESAARRKDATEPGWVASKLATLMSLAGLGEDLGVLTRIEEREELLATQQEADENSAIRLPSPIRNGAYRLTDLRCEDPVRFCYHLKQMYGKMLDALPDEGLATRKERRRGSLAVTYDIERIVGEASIVLYGSGAHDLQTANDLDLLVCVDGFDLEVYRELTGTRFVQDEKPVETILVRRRHLKKFITSNAYALGIVDKGMVISGEVKWPHVDERRATLQSIARSVNRIRSLGGVLLNWAALEPRAFYGDKRGLATTMCKTPRYLLGSLLDLEDVRQGIRPRTRSKQELDAMLESMGAGVQSGDPLESLYLARTACARVAKDLYEPAWVQRFPSEVEKINNPDKEFYTHLRAMLAEDRRQRAELARSDFPSRPVKSSP